MESNTISPTPATTLLPAITAEIQADPFNADGFLAVAVRLLRQRQLERQDVQEKLVRYVERKGVAR